MRVFVLTIFCLIAAEKFSPQDAESQSCPGMMMSPEWMKCRRLVLSACAFVGASQAVTCEVEALQRHHLRKVSFVYIAVDAKYAVANNKKPQVDWSRYERAWPMLRSTRRECHIAANVGL